MKLSIIFATLAVATLLSFSAMSTSTRMASAEAPLHDSACAIRAGSTLQPDVIAYLLAGDGSPEQTAERAHLLSAYRTAVGAGIFRTDGVNVYNQEGDICTEWELMTALEFEVLNEAFFKQLDPDAIPSVYPCTVFPTSHTAYYDNLGGLDIGNPGPGNVWSDGCTADAENAAVNPVLIIEDFLGISYAEFYTRETGTAWTAAHQALLDKRYFNWTPAPCTLGYACDLLPEPEAEVLTPAAPSIVELLPLRPPAAGFGDASDDRLTRYAALLVLAGVTLLLGLSVYGRIERR